MGKIKKEEKIKKVLGAYPEGLGPKQIGLYSNINPSTVKNLIKNMPGIVKKYGPRGVYILDQNYPHGEIFTWNFQNLNLRVEGIKIVKKLEKVLPFSLFKISIIFNPNNNKISMRLSTKHPLNISSVELVALFFVSEIKNNTGKNVEYSDIIVSSMEFNKDFENLRIDGANCITLDSLINNFKIYNKKKGVRFEDKPKIPFPLDSLMEVLTSGVQGIEMIKEVRETKDSYLRQENELKKLRNVIREIFRKRF